MRELSQQITAEQTVVFKNRLTLENIERAKVAAYIIMALEIFMLSRNVYNYGFSLHYYVLLYLSLLSVCILFLVGNKIIESRQQHHDQFIRNKYILMVIFIVLCFIGALPLH